MLETGFLSYVNTFFGKRKLLCYSSRRLIPFGKGFLTSENRFADREDSVNYYFALVATVISYIFKNYYRRMLKS